MVEYVRLKAIRAPLVPIKPHTTPNTSHALESREDCILFVKPASTQDPVVGAWLSIRGGCSAAWRRVQELGQRNSIHKLAGRNISSSSNGRPGRVVLLLCALAARKSPCLKARWLTRSVATLPGHGSAIWGGGAHESFSEAGRLLLVKTGGLATSLRLAGHREPASPPLSNPSPLSISPPASSRLR